MLSDGTLTLADLDEAFPGTPVLISTLSTLAGESNGAGLARLDIMSGTRAIQPWQIVKNPTQHIPAPLAVGADTPRPEFAGSPST